MIEQIEDLDPELGVEPLPEGEVLEDREIHVLVAVVAEEVPAHGAKGSKSRRNHDRVAGNEAASRRKRSGVGSILNTCVTK